MLETLLAVQERLHRAMAEVLGTMEMSGASVSLLLAAMAFGALHALMPGHGKSVLVSYHVGQAGRIRDGIASAGLLVLVHVGSAVALVLGGIAVLRAGLGAAAQAVTIQAVNAAFILLVGLWLSWRALRPHACRAPGRAWLVGALTGLAPCPLTTFVMSYAVTNAVVAAGLATVVAMAAGMLTTIAGVVLLAIAMRAWILRALERTHRWRRGAGRALEATGALSIVAIGALGI